MPSQRSPSAIRHRPSAIGHRPSAIGHRLSAIGYRLSAIGYRLSAIGYRLSATAMEPPHNHHLSAAIGWLELGNPSEGLSELEKLDPAWQDRADVLEVRWRLRAAQDEWAKALEAARRLAQADPERASGWLFQAYALRRVPDGGIQAAWEVLEPAEDRFPEEPTIPYNLACYACQLGELNHARRCLERAMKKASPDEIRQMALRDPDLEPLWKEIRNRNL